MQTPHKSSGEQIQTNSFCAARQWCQQFLSASWNIACLTYNNFLCGIKLQRYGRANINRLSEGRCRMRVKLINNRLMFLVGSSKRQEDEINIKLQLRECLTTVINMLIHGLDDFLWMSLDAKLNVHIKILASPRVIPDCGVHRVIKTP